MSSSNLLNTAFVVVVGVSLTGVLVQYIPRIEEFLHDQLGGGGGNFSYLSEIGKTKCRHEGCKRKASKMCVGKCQRQLCNVHGAVGREGADERHDEWLLTCASCPRAICQHCGECIKASRDLTCEQSPHRQTVEMSFLFRFFQLLSRT